MKYINGDGSMIQADEHAIHNGNGDIDDNCSPAAIVTPKKLSKSYVYQSDHSLVAVLRRRDDEDEDEDERSAWSGSDDSEAALTRVHRFCWAVCCCRSSSCCLQEQEVSDTTDDQGLQGLQGLPGGKKRRCSMLFSVLRAQFLLLRQRLEFAEHG